MQILYGGRQHHPRPQYIFYDVNIQQPVHNKKPARYMKIVKQGDQNQTDEQKENNTQQREKHRKF